MQQLNLSLKLTDHSLMMQMTHVCTVRSEYEQLNVVSVFTEQESNKDIAVMSV